MKDNKKSIFLVVGILVVLLIILALLHGCTKKEEPKKKTVEPKKDVIEVVEDTTEDDGGFYEEVQAVKVTPLVATASEEQILTLTLSGADRIEVDGCDSSQCPEFTDPGAFASDTVDGTISNIVTKIYLVTTDPDGNEVKTEVDKVDPSNGGATYIIEYTATNSAGQSKTVTRTVVIKDIKNVDLILNGAKTKTVTIADSNYSDEGVTAIETINGVDYILVPNVVITNDQNVEVSENEMLNAAGDYVITYTVTNSDGIKLNTTRNVTIEDNDGPVITLNEELVKDGVYTVKIGETADIASTYTVEDKDSRFDAANDTTVTITDIQGATVPSIDTTTLANYTVTIDATDPSGNDATTTTYTVKVVPNITVSFSDLKQETYQGNQVDYKEVTVSSIVDGTNNGANVLDNYNIERWSASRNRYEAVSGNPFKA